MMSDSDICRAFAEAFMGSRKEHPKYKDPHKTMSVAVSNALVVALPDEHLRGNNQKQMNKQHTGRKTASGLSGGDIRYGSFGA